MNIQNMDLGTVIDKLAEANLRVDGQVPQGEDKEEFSVIDSEGKEVAVLFQNKFDKLELYGPRMIREMFTEVSQ